MYIHIYFPILSYHKKIKEHTKNISNSHPTALRLGSAKNLYFDKYKYFFLKIERNFSLISSEFSQIHKFYKTILLLMLSFQDTKHDCKIWFASNSIAFLMRLFCYWCNIHSSLNKNGSRSD